MKALVYTGTQMSEIRDVDVPVAGDNQVLVDLAFCGICGSDMHAWHGHDERRVPPLVLGHEAVGIVQTGALAGKRVAINPLMTCGDCDCCNRGDEHLCPSRELIGMRVPGAFAEKLAIDSGNLTVIDDDLPFAEAALAEPLACSVHAVRLARQLAGDHRDAAIVVLGGGAIGLLAALVFEAYGYSDIQIAEPNALICFAGPRVIEQTIREQLPEGFQRAEYLLDHGMLDRVTHRKDMRAELITITRMLLNLPPEIKGELPAPEADMDPTEPEDGAVSTESESSVEAPDDGEEK